MNPTDNTQNPPESLLELAVASATETIVAGDADFADVTVQTGDNVAKRVLPAITVFADECPEKDTGMGIHVGNCHVVMLTNAFNKANPTQMLPLEEVKALHQRRVAKLYWALRGRTALTSLVNKPAGEDNRKVKGFHLLGIGRVANPRELQEQAFGHAIIIPVHFKPADRPSP